MKSKWGKGLRRAPQRREQRRFRAGIQSIPLRGRVDVVLAAGLLGVLALLATLVYMGVEWADSAGWLDPQLVEQIPDNRILTNVRDQITERPLLDAVWHKPDGTIVIAQTGGAFHSYDPATGLWQTERPFTADDAINTDFTLLRSGCGAHPLSDRKGACSDPDSLWAVSVEGGLARKLNGRWSIVVADSTFVGADGKLVNQDELTAAAVSGDGLWLVVGTRSNGIGFYSIKEHRWHMVSGDVQAALPALSVSHVAWSQGAFWIGGAQGVAKLTINGNLPAVETGAFPQIEVVDMDAREDGLWVLGRRACSEAGAGCLWLGSLLRGEAVPREIMVEQAIYPELNADALFFAQMWGDDLVAAGPAGIYRYSSTLHAWTRLFSSAVETVQPASTGEGFYFGYSGGAGLAAPSIEQHLTLWPVENEVVVHIALLREQDPLALTASGKAIALGGGGITATVYTPEVTRFDPNRFHAAIAAGDTLAFVSSEGILIHDLVKRTYVDLNAADLPRWLTAAGTRFVVSGNTLFAAATPELNSVSLYSMGLAQIVDPSFLLGGAAGLTAEVVPGPARTLWAWEPSGLGVLDGHGSIVRLEQGAAVQVLTGGQQYGFDLADFKDVIDLQGDLVVATDNGLQRYDMQKRTWSALPMPTKYGASAELAAFDGALYVRTAGGQLIRPDQNPAPVIGDNSSFSIGASELSDVLLQDNLLYHAGAGRIERYNTALRRIDETWDLSGADSVTLAAVADGKPLALNARRAYWGEQPLDAAAGDVLGLSRTGDSIWTVRELDGTRYLKGYPLANASADAATCFFRQPSAGPDVTAVHDALQLPNGWIAAATDAGLRFYGQEQRSWRTVRFEEIKPDRLYLTSRYLVLVQEGAEASAAAFVPLSSLSFPTSCSTSPVDFQYTSVQARAVAVDPGRDLAAWILADGSLHEWKDGQERLMLDGGGIGPAAADFRRVFQRDEYLLVVTDTGLWRYSLPSHKWVNIRLGLAPETVKDIDAEPLADGDMLTVSAGDSFYSGVLAASADSVPLNSAVVGDPSRPFGADGAQILDIQNRGDGLWTFVLTDRIKYLDPVRRTWRSDTPLGAADTSLELRQALGRGVAVGEQGRVWWIAQQAGSVPRSFIRFALHPGSQHALDGQGNIWALDGEGQLQKCAPSDGQYVCTSAAPAPFYLEPKGVEHAYLWDNFVLFATSDGLRSFDTGSRSAAPLPPEAAAFGGVRQAQIMGNELFLLGDQGLLVLRRSQAGTAGQLIGGVTDVIKDAAGRLWARFGNGWRQQQGSDFVTPALTDGKTLVEAGVRLLVAENGVPAGYDGYGYIYTLVDGAFVRSDLPLPQHLAGRTLAALVPGDRGELWLVADDGEWHHVASSRCAPAVPALPPVPPSVPTPGLDAANGAAVPISATISLTAALAMTLTPTVTPEPTPEPIPCMVDVNHQPLPIEFASGLTGEPLGAAYAAGRGFELNNNAGKALRINSRPAYRAVLYDAPALQRRAVERWQELQANVRPLASGRTAFAPILRLVVQDGKLYADRPAYAHQLASAGSLAPELPPALDAGWLQWNRSQDSATIATPSGRTAVAARDLVRDGHLLFEGIERLMALAPGRFYAASRFGVLFYPTPDLRLDAPTIQVALSSIFPPVQAAHGRFYAANGTFQPNGKLDSSAPSVWTIRLGSVALNETITSRSVGGSLPIGGQAVSPLTEQGFLWDTGRRSLAYANGKLLLLTAAGIHAAYDFGAFDPGPPGVLRDQGRLLVDAGQQIYLAAGEPPIFYSSSKSWQGQSRDPNADRAVFSSMAWTWRISQGKLDVVPTQDPQQFRISSLNGFGFTSDQLQFATAHAGSLFVMTNAFLETASTAGELADLSAARSGAAATDRLDELRHANGAPQIYRTAGGIATRWDDARRQFVAIAPVDNPFTRLVLVDHSRLRYTRLGDQLIMELRVDEVGGTPQWTAMTWLDGRFPFDVVTGVAVHDGRLYVGSAAGLQVFTSGTNLDIGSADAVLDMRPDSASPLAAVDRLGTPISRPDLIHIWAAARCVQRDSKGTFGACTNPALLDRRLRIKSDFWEWETDKTGALTGNYLSTAATRLPVTHRTGRLEHDNIKDAASCAGHSVTSWGNNWVTVYSGPGLAQDSSARNYDRRVDGVSDFLCVPSSFRTAAATVDAGLYLLGRGGHYWNYTGTDWRMAGDQTLDAALADYAAHPPIYMQKRLRLVKPAGGSAYTLEQRRIDLSWRPLPWVNDPAKGGYQVSIDQWSSFAWAGGQFWVGTPAGLVAMGQYGDTPVQLLPQQLHIIPLPDAAQPGCSLSDMEVIGGKLMLRCSADSTKVFGGSPTLDQDTGVFAGAGDDPFAARTWIDQGPNAWSVWRMQGRYGGAAGRLEGQLCLTATATSEAASTSCTDSITLGGGRFQFDTINSLALPGDQMIVATDTGGWFAYPQEELDLSNASRPAYAAIDSMAVTHVGNTLGPDDDPRLCAALKDGSFTTLSSDGRTDQPANCPEYAGSDSFWHYTASNGALEISAGLASEGGSGERQLVGGRFADDRVVGPPATGGEGSPTYFLPTAAGIMELDGGLNAARIHVGSFPGLGEGSSPSALYIWGGNTPSYLAQDGFHLLTGDRQVIHATTVTNPGQAPPQAVIDGPQESLMVTWPRADGGWGDWALVSAAAGEQLANNAFQLYVGDSKAYRSHRAAWGNPPPWLSIGLNPAALDASDAMGASVHVPIDPNFVLLTAVPVRDRLLLIGRTELLAVDLSQLIAGAFGAPKPTPTAAPTSTPSVALTPTPEPTMAAPTALPTTALLPTPVPSPTPTITAKVLSVGLNVRKGPGTEYDILITVTQNAPLRILGRWHKGGWLLVETTDRQKGWVSTSYVTPFDCEECIPEVTENPLPPD